MMRLNKKVGIVYCASSRKYADALVEIINNKKKEGYCIECEIASDESQD